MHVVPHKSNSEMDNPTSFRPEKIQESLITTLTNNLIANLQHKEINCKKELENIHLGFKDKLEIIAKNFANIAVINISNDKINIIIRNTLIQNLHDKPLNKQTSNMDKLQKHIIKHTITSSKNTCVKSVRR